MKNKRLLLFASVLFLMSCVKQKQSKQELLNGDYGVTIWGDYSDPMHSFMLAGSQKSGDTLYFRKCSSYLKGANNDSCLVEKYFISKENADSIRIYITNIINSPPSNKKSYPTKDGTKIRFYCSTENEFLTHSFVGKESIKSQNDLIRLMKLLNYKWSSL